MMAHLVVVAALLLHPAAATLSITLNGTASASYAAVRFSRWAGPCQYEYNFPIAQLVDAGRLSDYCDPVSARERLEKMEKRRRLLRRDYDVFASDQAQLIEQRK